MVFLPLKIIQVLQRLREDWVWGVRLSANIIEVILFLASFFTISKRQPLTFLHVILLIRIGEERTPNFKQIPSSRIRVRQWNQRTEASVCSRRFRLAIPLSHSAREGNSVDFRLCLCKTSLEELKNKPVVTEEVFTISPFD